MGLDTYTGTSPRKVREMILKHCIKIRDHERYKNALVVFYIEANLSKITANDIWDTIRQVPDFGDRRHVSRNDRLGVAGRFTTPFTKQQWVHQLQVHISTLTCVEKADFITSGDADEMHAKLVDQLRNFRRDVVPDNKDPALQRGPARVNVTGKDRGKTDDLCSALAFCLTNIDRDLHTQPDHILMARLRTTGRCAVF